MRIKHLVLIFALLTAGLLPSPAQAGGVVTVCDEAHLLAALAGGGTVTFACSGTITLTAEIVIAADTMIDGSGQAVTISGNDAVRVLTVNPGIMLNLDEINVAHGSALMGGGIVNNGMLTVNHSTVSGNSGGEDYGAGGIQNNGTLIVNNSVFSGNTAGSGGGIQNDGTMTVSNSTFSSNTADLGGGIQNNSTMTVSNSTFSSNTADEGGAIFNASLGTLTVSNSTFSGNSAVYQGGAISNRRSYFYSGRVTVTNSTFSGNSSGHGGGIQSNGILTVSNSTFTNNTADSGGGISAVTLTVSNSTFFGNSASLIGGGIAAFGWVSVTNSTFSGNRAANGGGIHSEGTLTVSSSTFPGNSATWDGGTYGYDSNPAMLRNTIVANSPEGGNCSGAFIDGGGNLSYPDTTCPGINADPVLGLLQDNGGPTWTMALGPGSAAIDAGDDATCAADPVNNLDQRGITRPAGAHCDIGALEQLRTWLPIILAQ